MEERGSQHVGRLGACRNYSIVVAGARRSRGVGVQVGARRMQMQGLVVLENIDLRRKKAESFSQSADVPLLLLEHCSAQSRREGFGGTVRKN
jgi:hypothetical protein